MQGALDKQSPLPGVVWNTTTLGRWHSGYHGFKPKLTNKLGLSFWLSSRQSPAVHLRTDEPVTQYEHVPVSTATVPPFQKAEFHYPLPPSRCLEII